MIQRNTLKGGKVTWTVRLRNPQGREYRHTFTTRKAAEAWQSAELADRARGKWVDPRLGAVPFSTVAAEWLESNPAKRPKTLANDQATIQLHLLPALGQHAVQAITRRDVQQLVNQWAQEAAPSTVLRRYAVLRAICNAAVLSDVIGRTPCRGIKLPDPRPKARRHVITADELARLCQVMPPRLALMPRIGAELGLRWGEVAGLRVGALDLLRHRLSVTWTVGEVRGKVVEGPPKSSASERTIRMAATFSQALAAHLAARGLTAANADRFVFAERNGGPLRYSNFHTRVWLPAVEAAGLPAGFRFHDLRHANATVMVAAGVDPKTAQTRLGHADMRTTMEWYVQADSGADEAAADTLGEHFTQAHNEALEGLS